VGRHRRLDPAHELDILVIRLLLLDVSRHVSVARLVQDAEDQQAAQQCRVNGGRSWRTYVAPVSRFQKESDGEQGKECDVDADAVVGPDPAGDQEAEDRAQAAHGGQKHCRDRQQTQAVPQ